MNEDSTESFPDPQRQLRGAIYHLTRSAVTKALAGAESTGAVLAIAQAALHHIEASVDGIRKSSGAQTVCAAGCSYCCWLNIDALAHEVILIAAYVRSHWTPWEVDDLRAAAEARRAHRLQQNHAQRQIDRQPCLLLKDAICSVYPVRPAACRRYFSRDLEACESLWKDPGAEAEVEFPDVHETGRAAAAAVHHAFLKAGLDGAYYDLPSALAEALADPSCADRWRGGEKAFSAASESRTPEGFHQADALRRLKEQLEAES
jgi:Fe-S-cluster containining protein